MWISTITGSARKFAMDQEFIKLLGFQYVEPIERSKAVYSVSSVGGFQRPQYIHYGSNSRGGGGFHCYLAAPCRMKLIGDDQVILRRCECLCGGHDCGGYLRHVVGSHHWCCGAPRSAPTRSPRRVLCRSNFPYPRRVVSPVWYGALCSAPTRTQGISDLVGFPHEALP